MHQHHSTHPGEAPAVLITGPSTSPGCNAEALPTHRPLSVSSAWLTPGGGAPGSAEGPPDPAAGAVSDAVQPLIHEERSSTPCHEGTYDEKPAVVEETSRRGIDALPGRLDRYAAGVNRGRLQAAYLAELLPGVDCPHERRRLARLADALSRCGDYLGFRHYFTIDDLRLHVACFCQQDKLCGLCQIRRASKILGAYSAKVATVMNDRPSLGGYMVTLTVRDGPDLGERVRHLLNAHSQCIARRRKQANGQGWTEWATAVAGVSRVEIKRGSGSGQWHPHIHSAWLCDRQPDVCQLRREWHTLTGDSHQVDVRPFESMKPGQPHTPETIGGDLVEVLKYSVKLSDMTPADALHVHDTTRGKKLLRPFGQLHGVEVPDELLDEPLNDQDLPFVDYYFRYSAGRYS